MKNFHPSGYLISIGLLLLVWMLSTCSSGTASPDDAVAESDISILKAEHVRPLTDVKFEATPERIARGKYLTEGVLWCFNCHTQRDSTKDGYPPMWEKKGSGALLLKSDSTWLYAPNITSDKETGIGNFSDDMIARAIREGIGHDDRALDLMPWWTFRGLTDEDLASVVCYVRTLPAIENKIPKRKLGREAEEKLSHESMPMVGGIDPPDLSTAFGRGKYLVGVADCVGCHTGWYGRNPGAFGGGNPMGPPTGHNTFSTNISSDPTGTGAWPLESFVYVIRNGKGKSGTLGNLMPWTSFKNMSDEDLEAVYQALMTTTPVKHIVQNGVAPTHCEVCGMDHGLGDKNRIEAITFKSNSPAPADVAGTYVGQLFPDTLMVALNEKELVIKGFGKEGKLIPVNANEYMAEGVHAPVHFVRDSNGKVMALQFNDLARPYRRVGNVSK